jgi:hypothetical protein
MSIRAMVPGNGGRASPPTGPPRGLPWFQLRHACSRRHKPPSRRCIAVATQQTPGVGPPLPEATPRATSCYSQGLYWTLPGINASMASIPPSNVGPRIGLKLRIGLQLLTDL